MSVRMDKGVSDYYDEIEEVMDTSFKYRFDDAMRSKSVLLLKEIIVSLDEKYDIDWETVVERAKQNTNHRLGV